MRTISRHWPTRLPGGDRQARCDYCGTQMRRSELHLNSMGLLYCDCVDQNEDTKQLEEDNRALAQPRPRPPDPGGTIDGHDYGSDANPNWTMRDLVGVAGNFKP